MPLARHARQGVAIWWAQGPRGAGSLLAVASVVTTLGGAADAAPDADCRAVDRGALSVDVGSGASATRRLTLKAGDALTFGFHSVPGPLGCLTLAEGAGSPRLLLAGPSGTSVSFVAPSRGLFVFQFAAEGAEAASFTASCVPAQTALRASAGSGSAAPRGAAKPATETWNRGHTLQAEEPAQVALEAGDAATRPRSEGPALAPLAAQRDATAGSMPSQATTLALKMQWRDQRYAAAGGPDGPEIDGNASGVDVGLNYTLKPHIMVGALAQFDRAGETVRGVSRSLLDQGWMVGPVTTAQFAPGLSLEGRAAWGIAENAADELATRAPGTQRRTVSARLANTQSFGALRVTPSISVNHLQETQHGVSASPTEALMPHTVGSGRVDLGPEVAYRIDLAGATFIEPKAAFGGFWGIDSLSKLAPGAAPQVDARLKAEAGVTLGMVNGPKVQAAGGVEEGDGTARDVWSGRLQLSVPLK